MLFPIILLYVTSYASAKSCERNQFWSSFLERCENCTRCVHPDIVVRPCQKHEDTVCGPLSVLNVDWSFMKHHNGGNGKNVNPQKEMLQTFKENFEEIRQHEKHVRERQKYLRQSRKMMKGSGEDYNEIEGDDIFLGDRHRTPLDKKELRERLKELGRLSKGSDDFVKNGKDDDRSSKLLEAMARLPAVLDSFTKNKMFHFDDDEAFRLLSSGKKKGSSYDANDLKFDENGNLVKDFGFSKVDPRLESVKVEKLVDEGKYEQKAGFVSHDWRLAVAAGLLITHTIIIVIIAIYCIRKNGNKLKGYIAAEMAEVQTWILPNEKDRKYPSSGIYKPTTEIRTVPNGSGKCKYLERIVNTNGKKKVNFYVGLKLPQELKPLTGKYPDIHKPVGDKV